MKECKECKECGSKFNYSLLNQTSTLYCSYECRSEVRKRVNHANKEKTKKRLKESLICDREWLVSHRLKTMKSGAKGRGLSFDLTYDDVNQFFKKDCHYCGNQLENVGLDRKDNEIGYVIDNVLPCCPTCNMMKHTQKYCSFINKCKKIAMKFN